MPSVKNLRWWIAGLLALATALVVVWISHLCLIGLGLMPLRMWRSFATPKGPNDSVGAWA